MGWIKDKLRGWLGVANDDAPTTIEGTSMKVSASTLAEARVSGNPPVNPWQPAAIPDFFPQAKTVTMALDAAPQGGFSITQLYAWAARGAITEGIGFLGYPFLAELTQRPEYRRISAIYAEEATRKGVKFKGDEDRIDAIEKRMAELKCWSVLREAVEHDGFFGRGQIFTDVGDKIGTPQATEELRKPFLPRAKIKKGGLKGFRTVEPIWSYPGTYESNSPLHPDFYKPREWYVMSDIVDSSRLFTIVGRQMPDMLKPAYAFGGLSLSQMVKPYVDNWLRTRQSVSDLLHSFSVMVLKTDMSAVLSGKASQGFFDRLDLFGRARDNKGMMVVDNEREELTNVSAPLGTLDKLLAQSQEQIASVCGIPLVILLGVTPSGLNASSDGEVRAFYANIKAYQERVLRDVLEAMLVYIQLDLDGKIDTSITFDFIDLWEMDGKEEAEIRKSDADMDVGYVGAGIVSNEEVRARISNDENNPYFGVDLSGPAPKMPAAPDDGGELGDAMEGHENDDPSLDADDASDPRGQGPKPD